MNSLLIILFISLQANAQKSHSLNYLHQKPPGLHAQLFAKGIISTDSIEHSSPAFSADGKTAVWAIMKMPSYQTRLLEMNFINNRWTSPQMPSFTDTTANEVYPNFSANGDTLYFCSDRKIKSSNANTIWYVTKTSDGWTEAKIVDSTSFKKDVYAHSISNNRNWYFTVGPHGTSDWNIFKRDNSKNVIPLPASINSRGYEDGPFIAPDESYLIFESDRGIATGNIDLFISFRNTDGSWTDPLNMGPKINTASAERFAKVSPDGRYIFFGRNTGNGFDIYWIDANIISDLKRKHLRSNIQDPSSKNEQQKLPKNNALR